MTQDDESQPCHTHNATLFSLPLAAPQTNNNMINSLVPCLKNDTAAGESYKRTWANYILAWLDGYAEAGLPMWGLTPQVSARV